jgi:hypothetical protein
VFGKAGLAVNRLARSRLEGYSGGLIAGGTFYLVNSPLRHYFTSLSYSKKNLALKFGNLCFELSFFAFFLVICKAFL